jgi:RNA polymerase sigma-70 factor (ECF subfamily)
MNGLPMAGALPIRLPNTSADRLSALFDAHYDRLYCLARRLAPDADAARDLVQETFLKVAASRTSVPVGMADEEAWLVRVLINIRRDEWRRSAVRKRHAGELRHPASVHNDPESALVARATVWRALDTLTPRRRAVVVMHEIDGLSFPAIASLLGINAITVRWHLSMGRRDLARILRPRMGATNDDR